MFFVLPAWGLTIGPLTAGIITLGIHYSTYTAEVYRAGIADVPKGQWEACTALNLPKSRVWLDVILPQAIRRVIPTLGNYLIGLFKETPLLAAITVLDVFGAANNIAGRTFRYNEPYTVAAVLLLTVSLLAAWAIRRIERRVTAHRGG